MGERMVVDEDEAYELLAFLVASAELSTFEPADYPTFRLMIAAERLLGFMLGHGGGDGAWLAEFKREVEQLTSRSGDREAHATRLREATAKLAGELKRRAESARPS